MEREVEAAAGLEFRLLGPFEVTRDGVVIDPGGPQQRAVLAHLVLAAGRVVAVDRLITRLWGDDPPASALGTLQSYVSRLRRTLEPGREAGVTPSLIASEAPGYALHVARQQVDVFRFEDLAAAGREAVDRSRPDVAVERFDAALAKWRGPALSGLGGEASIEPIIVRLEEERSNVIEDRFDALLALGRHGTVVGQLQEAVADHPLRERLWGQLALALYRSRRQADALRALSTARETLAEELGLDPGPELRQLEAQILAQDPALVTTPPPVVRATFDEPAAVPAAEAPLVGREPEWRGLTAALAAAASGRGGVVIVEGEPGIGKTTLLHALADEAAVRGVAVVTGQCVEKGLAPALWPWIEVLRAVIGADRRPEGTAVAELVATSSSGAAGKQPGSSVQLADEIAAMLAAAAAVRPVVVVLEDLHWADVATLEVLPLVAARLGDAAVLLAISQRLLDLGIASPFAVAVGALTRLPGTVRLTLAGLDLDSVAAVMTSIAGDAPPSEVVERVHRRTSGNPLFVTELARWSSTAGGPGADVVPDAVRDVVRHRLARLPERTLQVLAVAAVLGEEFDLRVLTEASELTTDECLDDLDPAMVIRVLVPSVDGHFRFSHALVRDAVLADLSPLRLARLHRRAADAIEAVFGADRDHAEPIGAHRWEAVAVDDPLVVTDALILAGDIARRRGAFDRADEMLEHALITAIRIPGGPERVAREISALESVLSVETLRSFMSDRLDEIADRVDEVARRNDSDAARQLARFTRWSHINKGRIREVEREAADAVELARSTESPYLVILGEYMGGVQCWVTGRLAESCDHFRTALAVRDAAASRPGKVALPPLNLGGIAAFAFEVAGDSEQADRCLGVLGGWLDDRPEDRTAVIDVAFMGGMVAAIRGDAAMTERRTAQVVDPNLAIRLPHFSPACRVLHGWAVTMQTGSAAGCEEAAAGLAEIDAGATKIGVPMFRSLLGESLLRVGDAVGAIGVLERARVEAESTGEVWWMPETLRLLAAARAALDFPAEEVDALRRAAVEVAEAHGSPVLAERARAEGGRQWFPTPSVG